MQKSPVDTVATTASTPPIFMYTGNGRCLFVVFTMALTLVGLCSSGHPVEGSLTYARRLCTNFGTQICSCIFAFGLASMKSVVR